MIDIHTYPIMVKELIDSDPNLWKVITKFFGFYFPPQPLSIFLMEMDEAGIQKVALLPLDCTVRYNCRIVSNEQVAELSDKNPRFIGFSSVDPRSKDAPRMLERAVCVPQNGQRYRTKEVAGRRRLLRRFAKSSGEICGCSRVQAAN